MFRTKLVFGLFLLAACSATKEVRIEDRTITVVPPAIEDTLFARVETTYVHGERVVMRDTVIQVKYFPVEKKFYVKAKPDTIRVTYRDTTKIVVEKIIETPFLSKVGLVASGFVLCVFIGIGIFLYFRFIKP